MRVRRPGETQTQPRAIAGRSTGGGSANSRLTLEQPNFLNLTLCLGFGARRKILVEALSVETRVELENDIPGGIREFCDEWILCASRPIWPVYGQIGCRGK
jgi:hypothetical protein